MKLLDSAELKLLIGERLQSREWWIIVGGGDLGKAIEERFYSGEANADFHVFFGPEPAVGILRLATAHKSRMSPEDLVKFLRENAPSLPEETLVEYLDEGTPDRDILCDGSQDPEYVLAMMRWMQEAWKECDG